ncbi:MAG: RNA methyltransferase [Deltaproteobacteria bacterium]|nr:RNA methyltransferase [Deltaproteobacteria bacterium]
MRRVLTANGDIFRPKGPLKREIDLATERTADVIRVLGGHLSDARRRHIDEVVAHRTRRLTVAVEGVSDPHNAAAVIRTADAFGVQTVHVVESGVRFVSSRKVTQSAHKWVDLVTWPAPGEFARAMSEAGFAILVAAADGALTVADVPRDRRVALAFGNEHEGVSAQMRGLAQGSFRVPMFGFVESLNVSVAAGVALAALRADGAGDLEPRDAETLRARFYLRAVKASVEIFEREGNGVKP